MKKAIRRIGRSLSRDRYGKKEDKNTNRPPSVQSTEPGQLVKSGSTSTLNSGFDRNSETGSRKSFRDTSINRLKKLFRGDSKDDAGSMRDNESLRSGRSSRSNRSIGTDRGRTRRRNTEFSGQKYLVKIELSIRRSGARPVFTQRTEIVMDNNPKEKTKNSPKPYFPLPMRDVTLDETGGFVLRAEVLGYPAPVVTFYKDDDDEPIMTQSQLHKTAKTPTGLYEILAENPHGSVSSKANVLSFNSPKSRPESLTSLPPVVPPSLTRVTPQRPSPRLPADTSLSTRSPSNGSLEKNQRTLADVKTQMKQRRLAPTFGNSLDKADSTESSSTSDQSLHKVDPPHLPDPIPVPRAKIFAPQQPEIARISPSYCAPPLEYRSRRAPSPTDSEYYSGGYESACMETPTASPRESPTPPDKLLIPGGSDELKRNSFCSDSEYMTSNEAYDSDVNLKVSVRRTPSNVSNMTTTDEEYLTAGGGSDTEVEDDLAESLPKISFFNKGPMHIPLLSSLSLSCEVTGVPEPDVKWFREENMLTSGQNGYQIRKICNRKWNLFVTQAAMEHGGEYAISVYNYKGSAYRTCHVVVEHAMRPPAMPDLLSSCDEYCSRSDLYLSDDTDTEHGRSIRPSYVKALPQKPEILRRLSNTTVNEGSRLVLSMEATGGPVSFYKNGDQLTETKRMKISSFRNQYDLIIEPILQQDHGAYIGRVVNNVGIVESRCVVNVIKLNHTDIRSRISSQATPAFDQIVEDVTIPIGGTAKFFVSVKSNPQAVIRWSLNDRAFLLGDKNVEITSSANGESTLILSNWVTQGTIACYASNAVGQAECKADLSLEKSNLERNYDLLKEEYRIHSGITSRGSYSIVKRASERKSGVEVALKSVCRKSVDKTGIRQETIILKQLNHVNVVRFIAGYHTLESLVLVTEWISGGNLFQKLIDEGKYSESRVMFFFEQICNALEFLHSKSIAHLDLRSESLLLAANHRRLIIIGFGNAREVQDDFLEPLDRAVPEFCSPEVASCMPVDCSSDVFSSGILLYILLTGESPFQGRTDKETLKNIQTNDHEKLKAEMKDKLSMTAQDLVLQCLTHEAHKRPSISEIAEDVSTLEFSDENTIDSKKLKYFFTRQRYNRKRSCSSSHLEPRRIHDIINEIDQNPTALSKRSALTSLSDSSDSEEDAEEEELAQELRDLEKEYGLTPTITWPESLDIPNISITSPTPVGSMISLSSSAESPSVIETSHRQLDDAQEDTSNSSIDQSRESQEDQKVNGNDTEMRNIFSTKKVPQLPKTFTPTIVRSNAPVKNAGWRKQVSFEDQMLRNEPMQTFVVPTPERKVKKPRTRGTLNRGRSLDNSKSSSDSDPETNRQAPAKPPRRKSKNRAPVEDRSEHPQLKGILKHQSSTEKQSDDSAGRRRLAFRRGSSVDSALPTYPSQKTKTNLRMRNKGHDSEDVPQRGGPLTFESDQRRKPQAADRPGAPYTLREVDGKIWLTWKDAGPGCLYRLQVRSNENQAWTDVSDKIDQNVHIVTGLMPGVGYRFRVIVRSKTGEIPSKASQRIGIRLNSN